MSDLFSDRLKTLRGPRNKARFAREIGLSPQIYQRYEGGRIPQANILAAIAERCGVTVEWLLNGSNPAAKTAIVATLRDTPAEYTAGPALPAGQWPRRLAEYLNAHRGVIEDMLRNGADWKTTVLGLIVAWVDEEKLRKEKVKS